MKSLDFIILLIPVIILDSCSVRNDKQKETISDQSSVAIVNAERFKLQKTDGCTIVTIIDPWQGADGIEQEYYLVKRGDKSPSSNNNSQIIYVPLKKIICTSTTHLAMITALGMEDAIAGVSGTGLIYDNNILSKVDKGLISDIGYDSGINSELIIKILPDLVMMYGIGGESAGYIAKIRELGIKVMFNADYLETDPLGKAEWIKLFGALFCREEMSDSIYSSIENLYNQTKTNISNNTKGRPLVLLGMPFRDIWYISPGNSYISKLIKDAGGEYLWENTVSDVSLAYGLESIYLQSLKADYWLNIGSVTSKNEISSFDPRFQAIPSFRNGNLFNNNRRITPDGGNDYWESGTLNPHIILKDIASILHPGLFRDYELTYYRKIE